MKVSLFFSGDVVNTQSREGFISKELQQIIKNQDFSICNFEAPIEGSGIKISKAGPHICQKKETIKILKDSGFQLLLLANNHMYDYGYPGITTTINEIEKHNLYTIGAGLDFRAVYKPLIKEFRGIKIAFLNASESQFGVLKDDTIKQKGGYACINSYLFDELVIYAKKNADIVIVCAHAGLEDYSVPIDEWRIRYKKLCDIGADCIIGSHPHVPQGYEIYNKKPIFYSLGNFFFDALSFKNSPDHSFSTILNITKKDISFDFVFHHKEDGQVKITQTDKVPFSIEDLNNQLKDKEIIELVYVDAYNKVIRPLYASSFNIILLSDPIKTIIKKLIFMILQLRLFKKRRKLILFHLVNNETYRWITLKFLQKD